MLLQSSQQLRLQTSPCIEGEDNAPLKRLGYHEKQDADQALRANITHAIVSSFYRLAPLVLRIGQTHFLVVHSGLFPIRELRLDPPSSSS